MKATSLEAYKNMQPKLKTDHESILEVLSKTKSLTYNEIAYNVYRNLLLKDSTRLKAFSWKNPNKASRRIKELLMDGKIKLKEVRKCTRAKSNCSAYVLC